MPTVRFRGRETDCEEGAILRDLLLDAGLTPHNGRASALNCRGHGTCGTCAVAVEGPTSDPTARERWRLSVPPHDPDAGLRLSCQTRVLGDLVVRKHPGFWGQHVDRGTVGGDGTDGDAGRDGPDDGDDGTRPGEPDGPDRGYEDRE